MKAAVLTALDTISMQEVPEPEPEPGEVQVRVAYTGVCGSDVPRVLQGTVHGYPLILGHEFSGTVSKLGEGADPSLLGQRVSGVPLIPCGECEVCEKGWYSLCSNYVFIGSRRAGSMAEYVCVPQKNVLPISDEVSDLEGAFFEPATIALHGIELAGVKPGARCAVVGGGTIGTLCALALQAYDPACVVVTRRSAEKFVSLESVGLTDLVATGEEDWLDRAFALAGHEGFDYVFDTAGANASILQSLQLAGPRATVCIIGTPKRDVSFTVRQWELINRKELLIRGSWMSYSKPWPGIEWQMARDLFADGTLRVSDEMIDAIYPLSEIRTAFDRFKDPHGVKGKILISSKE